MLARLIQARGIAVVAIPVGRLLFYMSGSDASPLVPIAMSAAPVTPLLQQHESTAEAKLQSTSSAHSALRSRLQFCIEEQLLGRCHRSAHARRDTSGNSRRLGAETGDVVPSRAIWAVSFGEPGVPALFMHAQRDIASPLGLLAGVALGRANWDVGRWNRGQRGTGCQQTDHYAEVHRSTSSSRCCGSSRRNIRGSRSSTGEVPSPHKCSSDIPFSCSISALQVDLQRIAQKIL